jgi:RHS repeat-associated protein
LEDRIAPATEPVFRGGLTVAVGDVTGDGVPDFVGAPGANAPPRAVVYDGIDGRQASSFLTHEASFLGGVYVAVGDVTGDGTPEVVAGAAAGGGPRVTVTDPRSGSALASFFAYDPAFRGGVRVAVADIDDDGRAEIVTAPGDGGGPHVRVFDGTGRNLGRDFMAYDPGFRGGATVAAADTDGDGRADFVTGPGRGGGPHVKVVSGATGAVLQSFFADAPTDRGGVWVAAADVDGNGLADVVTGSGVGRASHVRAFAGAGTAFAEWEVYEPSFLGGVRVATADVNGDGFADVLTGPAAGGGPRITIWDGYRFTRTHNFFAVTDGQPLGFGLKAPPPRTPLFDGSTFVVPGTPGGRAAFASDVLRRFTELPGELGVFRVDDRDERVGALRPGDDGYAQVALSADRRIRLFAPTAEPGTGAGVELGAGQRYAFYLIRGGSFEEWAAAGFANTPGLGSVFPFPAANPGGAAQFRVGPRNRAAFEDIAGLDDDFNDVIMDVRLAGEPSDVGGEPIEPGAANKVPVATDDTASTAFGTPVLIDVLSNDADPDGHALTLAAVGVPGHGAARIVGSRVEYTPAAGFSGRDTFSYSVNDGFGGAGTASVTVTVAGPAVPPAGNRSPIATDDAAMTAFETPIFLDVLANDADPDGDPLVVSVVDGPTHGTARVVGSKVEYTPVAGFSGADALRYAADDGRGGTAVATVAVTVMPRQADFTAWTAAERGGSAGVRGGVTVAPDAAVLREGDSFVTSLSKSFVVPAVPVTVSFTYSALAFDGTAAGLVNDAFEAALVDRDGRPLVTAYAGGRDAFFNATHGVAAATGADVSEQGGTVSIDLSGVPAGTVATLIIRLVNNDADTGSVVTVTGYSLPPADRGDAPVKFFVVDAGSDRASRHGVEGLAAGAFPLAGSEPRGVASNPAGDRVWVVDAGKDQVAVYDAGGTAKGSWTAADAGDPQGVAVHDGDLWLVDRGSRRVLRYDGGAVRTAGTSAASSAFDLVPDNTSPSDLVTDGATVWVTDDARKEVFVYDGSGTPLGRWTLDGDNAAPSGITRDPTGGTDLWVLDRDAKRVFQYAAGTDLRSGAAVADGTFDLAPGAVAPEGIADPPVLTISSPPDRTTLPIGSKLVINGSAVPSETRDATPAPILTFEEVGGSPLPEGTSVADQYASEFGLRFSTNGPAFPFIVHEGGPKIAYAGPPGGSAPDTPADGQGVGGRFLSFAPGPDGRLPQLHIDYATPVARASGHILDIDGRESKLTVFESVGTPGYYNQSLGRILDGTSELFPVEFDPFLPNAPEPDLTPAAAILGNWLNPSPLPLNENWSFQPIPIGWPVSTETAVVYEIDGGPGGIKNLTGSFGVDNGLFVWVNGVYKFGALSPGSYSTDEYPNIPLGDLKPGKNYLQILREDHGLTNGFYVRIEGELIPAESWLIEALNQDGVVIDQTTAGPSTKNAGDGLATSWGFTHGQADISRVRITYAGTVTGDPDFAFDNIAGVPDSTARAADIVAMTVNGSPVASLDPAGNFFDRVTIGPGENRFDVTAYDSLGESTTRSVTLIGSQRGGVDQTQLVDLSATFKAEYARTSFDAVSRSLYAQVAVRNLGSYPAPVPLYVGVRNISDPKVRVLNPAGVFEDGTPYYDFTGLLSGGATRLDPSAATGQLDLSFAVPGRKQFTYDLVFFGVPNRPPAFTSVPPLEAHPGRTYGYAIDATDPDGDTVRYSLVSGPDGMAVDPAIGGVTWVPSVEQLGSFDVTVWADDGRGGTAEQRFSLVSTVAPPNRPPVFMTLPGDEATAGGEYRYDADAVDPDGDTPSYSLGQGSPPGMQIDPGTGVITWSPSNAQIGDAAVTVVADDGRGGVSSQAFNVCIEATGNRPPVIVTEPVQQAFADGETIPGDKLVRTYTYDVEALDPDGGLTKYSLTEAPSGMMIDAETGLIQWMPGRTTNLVRNLDFSSGLLDFTSALQFSPSSGWDDGIYTIINSPFPWHPWAADFGDHTTGTGPMMVINGSSTPDALVWQQDVTIKPETNYEFSFWARSWTSGAPGKLQLAVNGAAVGAELTLPTDTGRWVRYSGLWRSGISQTATISIRNAESAFSGNDFAIDDIGFSETFVTNQRVPVSVRVDDGRGGSDKQSFSVTVTDSAPPSPLPAIDPNLATNDAPAWATDELPEAEVRTNYRFALPVVDPDGDSVAYSVISGPDGLLVHPTLGVLAWFPLRNQVGTHQVVVLAKEDHDNVTVKSLEVTVRSPNTPPVVVSIPPSGLASVGSPFVYQVVAQDAEQPAVGFSLVDPSAGMSVDATGSFTWTPTASDVGTNAVTVRVTDGVGGVTDHVFTLVIATSPLNAIPDAKLEARTTAWLGQELVGRVVASDPDGDPLTYSLVAAPPGLSIEATGVIRWLPGNNSALPIPLEIKVSDGRGGELTLSAELTVLTNGSNAAPVVTSVPRTVATADALYGYDLVARDPDGDPVLWELVTGPQGMSLDAGRGTLRWVPEHDQTGSFVVTVRATDAYGASAEQTFTVSVSCVNQPPRISSVPVTTANANFVYAYAVRASDPNNDPLTFALDQSPAGMAFLPGTSIIRWVPTAAQVGPQAVTVRVTDRAGNVTTQTFTVIVEATAPNRSPLITSPARTVATLGTAYEYAVAASDPDGDPLAYHLLAGPDGMTIDGETGVVVWPNPVAGTTTVSVAVTDGRGGRGVQTFTLTGRANQAPALAAVPNQSVAAGAPFRYGLTATDPDGDAITYRLVQAPAGMTVDDFGRVVWQSSGPPRAETVTVAATDIGGLSSSRTFVLTLTPDAQAPRVSLFVSPNVTTKGQAVTVQVAATDNVGVTALAVAVVQGGVTTPLALTPQGRATFTPSALGRYTFVATAADAAGNEGRASAELRAVDPNDTAGPDVSFTRLVELLPNGKTRVLDPTAVTASVGSLTDVFATIRDAAGGLDTWVVRVARADQVDYRNIDIDAPAWRTIAAGSGEIADGKVATFDPTALTNDRYVLAVAAYDVNGRGTVRGVEIDVAGGVKLGEFSLSFTDLSLPLNGIPIEVTRVYDSREAAASGDFGFGWRLGLRNARIRETVPPGAGNGLFSDAQPFRTGTKVYLDLPDGRRAGFAFAPEFGGGGFFFSFSNPKFATDPGFEGYRLEVDATPISQRADGSWGTPLFSLDYNPNDYRLVTPEGLTYFYNQQAGLQKITDQNNNVVTFTSAGIFHSGGRHIDFVRDGQGRITSIVDVAGKSITYGYDAAGDLRTFADQTAATTKFAYNPARAHYLDTITDPSGRQAVKTEYDAAGRVVAITDANGNRVVQEFDAVNFRETIRDARGKPTILTYNERGNVTRKETPTDFGPVVEQFFYEDPANPDKETKIINPRGFATTRSFDARGNLLNETTADGTTKYTYNTANKLTSVVDTLGRTTAYDYSAQGNLVRVVNPLGDDSLFTYDSLGRVASYEDFSGNKTMFLDYCSCGRPRTIQNPDGSIRTLETNAFSQITKVTDEIGNVTQNFYDDFGRLIRVVDGVGAETKYDYQPGSANVTKITDPLGNVTEYKYDGANNKTQIIDAEGGVTIFGYDKANNLTSVTDPVNNVTKFVYDQANRLKEEIDPLGKSRFYTLDAAGNKIAILDRNNKTRTFTFDALNRNTQENWLAADGSVVRVIASAYDKAGNLLTANDPDAKLSYTYDALNRVKTATTEYPGTSVPVTTLTYDYDANGNRKSVVDNFGVRVDSVYSDRNELLSRTMQGGGVSAARVEFEYADNGERKLLERFADATGTTLVGSTSYAYFANGLSKTITHKNAAGGTLVNYDYLYDLAGRLKSEVHHGDTYQYGYDKTGQFLTVNKGGSLFESFTYDKNGNRKTSTGPNGDQTYAPAGAGNRLLNDGQNTYSYDGEGNLKTKTKIATGEVTDYTWDNRSRLVLVETRSQGGIIINTTSYRYDSTDRRISQVGNGTPIFSSYDKDSVWLDTNAAGVATSRYIYSDRIDEILSSVTANADRKWQLSDKLGTLRDIQGNNSLILNSTSYASFGAVLSQSNSSVAERFGYTGREISPAGVYYYRARYYDPLLGKFMSNDPLGFFGPDASLNRYVNNSPNNFNDPYGLAALPEYSLLQKTVINGFIGAALGLKYKVICKVINGDSVTGKDVVVGTLIGLGAGVAFPLLSAAFATGATAPYLGGILNALSTFFGKAFIRNTTIGTLLPTNLQAFNCVLFGDAPYLG